jgi:hypothetical protein
MLPRPADEVPRPRPRDPAAEHAALEENTEHFRKRQASKHAKVLRERCASYRAHVRQLEEHEGAPPPPLVEALHEDVNAIKWRQGRMRGQLERFANVRGCGGRKMVAECRSCGHERAPISESCGVRRVCARCDTSGARKRRARFGRARGRVMIEAKRYGLFHRNRKGGRYSEKMLTLTVPHAQLSEASGHVASSERVECTLSARIEALFAAWAPFLRRVNDWMRRNDHRHFAFHRAFEWTPAKDGDGHPHFHVYLWSPWLPIDLLRAWWADCLREVGWPVETYEDEHGNERDRISVDLRRLRSFSLDAVRELLKGDTRKALTLSRVEFVRADDPGASAFTRRSSPGMDAFRYAEGWTLASCENVSHDVRARLYCALEGRRLTQAARGFFVADVPCECSRCHASYFRVMFVQPDAAQLAGVGGSSLATGERGPPS